jgi:Spy/CpxP family protein refolding chaperone
MFAFWQRARRAAAACATTSCGPEGAGCEEYFTASDDGLDGGAFGVRRPLRFLAFKLQLREAQVAELARILNDLKTERAQAAVDYRRSTSHLADALAGEKFDEARAAQAGQQRVQSAERVRDAVLAALSRIHAMLDPDQRERLAYLLRTGALSI